jgi:tungstate transport system ATP-binding protein
LNAPDLIFDSVEVLADGEQVLGPVSMRLASVGITVIMGANGAGKSLFLTTAHGLVAPHRGRVIWNGIPADSSRKSRGFVFQNTPVLRRSVAGNVAFPLSARKMPAIEKATLVARALAEARLTSQAHQPAAALSGGELKRLALARAMVTDPAVILLDEPAANLDPATTKELEDSLRRISDAGTKVILSTHDIAQARRLAGDILFFDAGLLIEQASAAAFFANPISQAAQKYLKGEL